MSKFSCCLGLGNKGHAANAGSFKKQLLITSGLVSEIVNQWSDAADSESAKQKQKPAKYSHFFSSPYILCSPPNAAGQGHILVGQAQNLKMTSESCIKSANNCSTYAGDSNVWRRAN